MKQWTFLKDDLCIKDIEFHSCNSLIYMQDFWNRILADPRGESVDKGNMKLAFESVSEPHDTTSSFE